MAISGSMHDFSGVSFYGLVHPYMLLTVYCVLRTRNDAHLLILGFRCDSSSQLLSKPQHMLNSGRPKFC